MMGWPDVNFPHIQHLEGQITCSKMHNIGRRLRAAYIERMQSESPQENPNAAVAVKTANLLLEAMFQKTSDGRTHKFMFGKPGAAHWEQRFATEVQYSRHGLQKAALYLRESGPKYIAALPINAIESRLMNFVQENYWYFIHEVFGALFTGSYAQLVSSEAKANFAKAMESSNLFNAPTEISFYPIVPIRVEDAFDGGAFFLIPPSSFLSKLPSGLRPELFVPHQFPPWAEHKGIKHSPQSWLGTRAQTTQASHKIKAAVLGAIALLPHRHQRYTFSGRNMFGGQFVVTDGVSMSFGEAHTPPLYDDLVIAATDHLWLQRLSDKFTSETKKDRKHLKALEYYYRAWGPRPVERFPTLFMALDAIYGDAGAATQSVIDAIGPVMGPEYTYDRLKRLLSLRASVVHGGAPEVCESDNYHRYYVDYGEDPIADLDLIVARCFQTVIFEGDFKERPHTHADLIKKRKPDGSFKGSREAPLLCVRQGAEPHTRLR
jgi:hypothetical protein